MADTVKLPLLGTQKKSTVMLMGVGGLAIAGYMVYKYEQTKKQQAAAAAAAQAQTAAASNAYGYSAYGYGGTGYYGYGDYYGYGASGGFNAGYYGYGTPEPLAVANTTNAQWTQAAVTQLSNEGYTATTVSAALGAYLAGSPVTSAQQTIIQSAIAVEGYPPQSGTNGYPPSINVQGTTGGGTGGGQTSTSSTTGLYSGTGPQPPETQPGLVTQPLSATGYKAGTANFSWGAASNAAMYEVLVTQNGRTVSEVEVAGTHATLYNLPANQTFQWQVIPLSSGGAASAGTAGPTFSTTN